ncbi:MAG: iron ABC transporter permease [Bacteroidales bacterium]|nr:iron ABC transporter permease [Bacteroidales bacterium]
MKNRYPSVVAILVLVVAFLAVMDLLCGGAGFGAPGQVIFTKLRLPRMLMSLLAGASLALAGLQMQTIFRNPLADPHIMGVSAGAGTGAAVATLLVGTSLPGLFSGLTVVSAAFIGALLTSALVVIVASRMMNATTLLIFGVMLGFVFSALTAILEYSANAESLKVFYSWSAGSFIAGGYEGIVIVSCALAAGLLLALFNNRHLDVALFGEDYSSMAGVRPSRTRNISMIGSCLMAGAVTAFCGPLGFVGIVAPHIARAVAGTSVHIKTIPVTLLTGAGLSLSADILSQVFGRPLPVGSTMAIIGIPIILYILLKR